MASASTCEERRRREQGTLFLLSRRAERLADEAAWDDMTTTTVETVEGATAVEAVEGATVEAITVAEARVSTIV
jgi:hypothetical protein